MASSSLRRFSACSAFLETRSSFLELGQALHQPAHVGAEQLVDLLARGRRVLDRVVEKRHRNGRFIQMHVGEESPPLRADARNRDPPEARFWLPCFCMA